MSNMKKIIFTSLLAAAAFLTATAQNATPKNGSWGVDHEKRVIVINDSNVRTSSSLQLDKTYVLDEPLKMGKAITARDGEGNEYRAYLSTIPIINITTDGEIVNSPAVHGVMSVNDGTTTLTVNAGLKIRGTSSQQYDKKSYRIELWRDEVGAVTADTVLLDLRNDDDWNLEAMAEQPLRLRNKVANELWQEMYELPYLDSTNSANAHSSVRMRYVDLFINDSYTGIYTLTERIDRKQLGLKKYSTKIRGLLVKGNGEGAPSFETLPAYSNTSDTWDNFEWVYPNEDDSIIDWSSIYSLVNFVKNASVNVFNSQYASMFDQDNIIDYYLFINTLDAADNMARNIFLARYNKSGTYFYVPWDLDAILGLDGNGQESNNTTGLRTNGLFSRLMDTCYTNNFTAKLQERYSELRNTLLNTNYIMSKINAEYNYLNDNGAYAREAEAWSNFTLDPNELTKISTWLDNRFSYLDYTILEDCESWSTHESTTDNTIKVYPNPANETLYIEKPNSGFATIRLYDITGRLVMETADSSETTHISVASLPAGIYTVVLNANDWHETCRVTIGR